MREPDVGYEIDRHLAAEERDELIEEEAEELSAAAPDHEWHRHVGEAAEALAAEGDPEVLEQLEAAVPGLLERLALNWGTTAAEAEVLAGLDFVTDRAMDHYRKEAAARWGLPALL